MKIWKKCYALIKFLYKEVLLKYVFCYILCGVTLLITVSHDLQDPLKSWLISLSASLISLPVCFVVYTHYNKMLNNRTRKKVSYKFDKDINNIFARFIFFTQYFYNRLEEDLEGDDESLNAILNYSEDDIFKKVADNVFSGVFLFGEFDSFDEYVYETINQPVIAKYLTDQEVALLFDFMRLFEDLKEFVRIINSTDFILCGTYANLEITESRNTKNSEGKLFYDVCIKDDEGKNAGIYTALYPMFEEDKLKYMIKLSGNKSKEVANIIFELYNCIKKWLQYKEKRDIACEKSIVFGGRLYLEADLRINEYMDNNLAFNGKF